MTAPSVRKILFVTGTRADFGKLLPLMRAVEEAEDFECGIFATGMHTLQLYGYTICEVRRAGFKNIYTYMNQCINDPMDLMLANTISGLARFIHEDPPDLIVVHGDRIEALAGAAVGALRNVLVAHIEGGELSGTVDELIRHAVSKLSHLHLVANDEAARRLRQMGEGEREIFIIGSPDLDIMASTNLPSMEQVRERYGIMFDRYAVALFHPVTTEVDQISEQAANFVDALIASGLNYVVVYPNNDEGTMAIISEYKRLIGLERFKIFPSIRFEYFVSLMKNMDFIIGNSSAGVREAPFYSRPSINIGTRQQNRCNHPAILNTSHDKEGILNSIQTALAMGPLPSSTQFGEGRSQESFMNFLRDPTVWETSKQKQFKEFSSTTVSFDKEL